MKQGGYRKTVSFKFLRALESWLREDEKQPRDCRRAPFVCE